MKEKVDSAKCDFYKDDSCQGLNSKYDPHAAIVFIKDKAGVHGQTIEEFKTKHGCFECEKNK